MCKKVLILVITLLSCHSLFSQDGWDWDVNVTKQDRNFTLALGPKVGCGMAIGSSDLIDFPNGLAYQLGAFANLHFGRKSAQSPIGTELLGIDAEALYGVRSIGTQAGKMAMRCMEVPLLVQSYPIPSLAIEAGLTFVKILKCTSNPLIVENVIHNDNSDLHEYVFFTDLSQLKGSSDVMLTFGVCYKAPFKLMVDVRYNLGTSDLAGNFDTKVRSLTFSVAYLFDLIK